MLYRIKQIFILLMPVLLASCSFGEKNIRVRSSEIAIGFDRNLHCNIQWLPAGSGSIVAFDPAIQSGIIADGKPCFTFNKDIGILSKRKIVDKEFGPGLEAMVTGIFEEGELKIKR